jgi:hypothetical protein
LLCVENFHFSWIIDARIPDQQLVRIIIINVMFSLIKNLLKIINVVRYIDVDECENSNANSCHEYAHCENDAGKYICTCFDGFFGDGKECEGK